MKFTLEQLNEKSKNRPQGYREEVLSLAKKTDNYFYELSDESFAILAEKYRMPSFLEMITNAGKAALEAANSGLDVRDKEQTETCLKICAICPHLVIDPFRCGICGCFLEYKIKLKAWHCPQNRW